MNSNNLVIMQQGGKKPGSAKSCRAKCGPGYKKNIEEKNICSGTNIQNAQNENIHRCVTYICIYPRETRSIIWGENYVLNLGVAVNLIYLS